MRFMTSGYFVWLIAMATLNFIKGNFLKDNFKTTKAVRLEFGTNIAWVRAIQNI